MALILSIGLVLTAFPNEFCAVEENQAVSMVNDEEVREKLIEKAVEVFPEYEKEIRGENEINIGKARGGGMGEVVYTETRNISETDVVTYTQFDTGIATTAIGMAVGKKETNLFHRGQYMLYEMNIWLMCGNSQDCLFVKTFGYGVYTNAYDKIIYDGIFDEALCTTDFTCIESKITNETANAPAKIVYGGYFGFTVNIDGDDLPYSIYGRLIVEVANDTYTLSCSY